MVLGLLNKHSRVFPALIDFYAAAILNDTVHELLHVLDTLLSLGL